MVNGPGDGWRMWMEVATRAQRGRGEKVRVLVGVSGLAVVGVPVRSGKPPGR
jgi:hypothetical protein